MFNATTWILWVFLANGNVLVAHEYRTLDSCLETQRIIEADQQSRGSRAVDRMLCLPADGHGARAGVQ